MLSMMDDAHSLRVIGTHPSASEREAYSVERHVGADTPPTFLAQAADDPVCPVENSLMMFAALRTAHIPTEMHIFQSSGHGWGLGRAGTEAHAWPELFVRWAKQNSLLTDGDWYSAVSVIANALRMTWMLQKESGWIRKGSNEIGADIFKAGLSFRPNQTLVRSQITESNFAYVEFPFGDRRDRNLPYVRVALVWRVVQNDGIFTSPRLLRGEAGW
jgi:hypothetical protein